MTKNTHLPEITALSFEEALSQLEGIVKELESGKAGLEGSIQAYERGVQLRQQCELRLKDAQLRIEKLSLSPNGQPILQPHEI